MINETKQTAVEWLFNQMINSDSKHWIDFYNEAKEMEKEQMIDFACDCSEMFRCQIKVEYENTYGGNK